MLALYVGALAATKSCNFCNLVTLVPFVTCAVYSCTCVNTVAPFRRHLRGGSPSLRQGVCVRAADPRCVTLPAWICPIPARFGTMLPTVPLFRPPTRLRVCDFCLDMVPVGAVLHRLRRQRRPWYRHLLHRLLLDPMLRNPCLVTNRPFCSTA